MLCKSYGPAMSTLRAAAYRRASTGFQANHLARLFSQALAQALRPVELAPAQFIVLIELWGGPPLTQSDLMRRLDVEQATMGNTLKRMERDGLIVRNPHPDDCRSQLIAVTERAAKLEQAAKSAAGNVNSVATRGLTAVEMETFSALTLRVIDALRRHRSRDEDDPPVDRVVGPD
jgi:DNA-binding MarR family transcriptional regulator